MLFELWIRKESFTMEVDHTIMEIGLYSYKEWQNRQFSC